jgi:hypothetical protein
VHGQANRVDRYLPSTEKGRENIAECVAEIAVSRIDVNVSSIANSFDPSLVGKRVPQTPAHVFTESLTYFVLRRFRLQVLAKVSASQFDDDRNVLTLSPYSTFGVSLARQPRAGPNCFCRFELVLRED